MTDTQLIDRHLYVYGMPQPFYPNVIWKNRRPLLFFTYDTNGSGLFLPPLLYIVINYNTSFTDPPGNGGAFRPVGYSIQV